MLFGENTVIMNHKFAAEYIDTSKKTGSVMLPVFRIFQILVVVYRSFSPNNHSVLAECENSFYLRQSIQNELCCYITFFSKFF